MCYITLIKTAVIGITGVGVGMAFKNQITNLGKNAINGFRNLRRKTQKAFHEGERSVNPRGDAQKEDLSTKHAAYFDKKCSPQDERDLPVGKSANATNDLRTQFEQVEERNAQLEGEIRELRTKNFKMNTELEVLRGKLEAAKNLSRDYYRELLLCLQKILGKSEGKDIGELVSILLKHGLTVHKNYENFSNGFICVKDAQVTAPEISIPALARGDNIEMNGIVKVPMSFAGAEPPVGYAKVESPAEAVESNRNGEASESLDSKETVSESANRVRPEVSQESSALVLKEQNTNNAESVTDSVSERQHRIENDESTFDNDDFILTTKERTKS